MAITRTELRFGRRPYATMFGRRPDMRITAARAMDSHALDTVVEAATRLEQRGRERRRASPLLYRAGIRGPVATTAPD